MKFILSGIAQTKYALENKLQWWKQYYTGSNASAEIEIAKKAYSEKRAIIDVAEEMTTIERKELESLLDPKNLIKPYF